MTEDVQENYRSDISIKDYANKLYIDPQYGYDEPKSKIMRFDKPFLLLLKRKDSSNPYFGLWITNTELMLKE